MNIRSICYWIVCIAVAFAAAHGAAGFDKETVSVVAGEAERAAAVSETAKAVLLAAGILAVAFFYRRAWMNITRRRAR